MILRISLYANAALLILCMALGLLLQYEQGRKHKALAELGKAQVAAQIAAREAEHRHAQAVAAIADKYEQDKRAADEAQRKLVSDLRAGTVRLQDRWAGCVSEAGRTAAELDAARRDREDSAARIIGAGRKADDQIRRLQEVVRSDRQSGK